jgi:ubiquitin C-terminal hydrolase
MFGRQEDSHQVLLTVLHALHSAFLQESVDIPPKMVDQETTLIHQLFGGVLASQLLCTDCGHASTTFESCLDLSLEIHEHTDTLSEMLEAFTCPERLDRENKIRCQGCKTEVRAHKQISIFKAPNILCIQLKRFRMGFFGKVNKYVQYSTTLDLQPFMSHGSSDTDVVYDLYGVLIHLDLFNISSFGHYVACIKGTDGKW